MVKPNRSEPEEDEEEKAWQQQVHEAIASASAQQQSKRAVYRKPSRSEPDEVSLPPEASRLERQTWRQQELLRLPTQDLEPISTTTAEAADEYTASDYYEGVRLVNKEHHHTTGTGLIKVNEPSNFQYLSRPVLNDSRAPVKGKSNPAMNDWVPAPEVPEHATRSCKPSRSESNVDFD